MRERRLRREDDHLLQLRSDMLMIEDKATRVEKIQEYLTDQGTAQSDVRESQDRGPRKEIDHRLHVQELLHKDLELHHQKSDVHLQLGEVLQEVRHLNLGEALVQEPEGIVHHLLASEEVHEDVTAPIQVAIDELHRLIATIVDRCRPHSAIKWTHRMVISRIQQLATQNSSANSTCKKNFTCHNGTTRIHLQNDRTLMTEFIECSLIPQHTIQARMPNKTINMTVILIKFNMTIKAECSTMTCTTSIKCFHRIIIFNHLLTQ